MMGEHSLLLQDGDAHRRARTLLMPAFNGHALREYGALVTEVARADVATWRDGEELRALDRMNRLTLEVILRVVFGVADERRLALLRPRVKRVVDISPAVLFGWSDAAAATGRPVAGRPAERRGARPADPRRDPRARGPRPTSRPAPTCSPG